MTSPAGSLAPGSVIGGRYKVDKIVGRGAMGIAYRCHDPDGNEVAVKALQLRGLKG